MKIFIASSRVKIVVCVGDLSLFFSFSFSSCFSSCSSFCSSVMSLSSVVFCS